MSDNFSFINTTKAKLPSLAFVRSASKDAEKIFEEMKDAVLGADYSLDVAIVDAEHMHKLNKQYRNIDKATDILSFPLSDTEGEIYINLEETKKEAKNFDRTYDNFLAFLFIHGLVHLKGFDHGSIMDDIEADFRKKFGI